MRIWKSKYDGMDVSEAQRLKSLEDENIKLKKLLTNAMLDNLALESLLGKMVAPAARRKAIAYLREVFEMSHRRTGTAFAA